MLTHLEMTGNSLNSLNLRGANDAFQKNLLAHIALPSNGISKLTMVDNYGVHHLNLAGNRLTELSMRDTDNMETLDLSGNALSTLNLSYCERLVSARLSDNCLAEIVMPADVTYLDELDIRKVIEFRSRLGQGIEKCTLSHVGKTYDTQLHDLFTVQT